jgi:hypothetical protein
VIDFSNKYSLGFVGIGAAPPSFPLRPLEADPVSGGGDAGWLAGSHYLNLNLLKERRKLRLSLAA